MIIALCAFALVQTRTSTPLPHTRLCHARTYEAPKRRAQVRHISKKGRCLQPLVKWFGRLSAAVIGGMSAPDSPRGARELTLAELCARAASSTRKADTTWNDVLARWRQGEPAGVFPDQPFLWNTSAYRANGAVPYRERFIADLALPSTQDYSPFKNYLKGAKDGAVDFPNFDKSAYLVVPTPRRGKNFATLYHFNQSASATQKAQLWKLVAKVVRRQAKVWPRVWVSVHGHGVPYLHVRVSSRPRYYFDQQLALS